MGLADKDAKTNKNNNKMTKYVKLVKIKLEIQP